MGNGGSRQVRARKPVSIVFGDDGIVPNDPRLPLIVYRGAVDPIKGNGFKPGTVATPSSDRMAGGGPGETQSTISSTTILKFMKRWASLAVTRCAADPTPA